MLTQAQTVAGEPDEPERHRGPGQSDEHRPSDLGQRECVDIVPECLLEEAPFSTDREEPGE